VEYSSSATGYAPCERDERAGGAAALTSKRPQALRGAGRKAGISAADERLEIPANDEARRDGKEGVDTRASLPYTSPPLGKRGWREAARAAISASVL
jgi:hypothetical protein